MPPRPLGRTHGHPGAILALAGSIAIAGCALAGCAGAPPRPHASYEDRARALYEEGMAQMQRRDWTGADATFLRVRHDHGMTRWAVLSDLRRADLDFKQDKFVEAAGAFRSWLQRHRQDPEAVYAAFMIAKCYFKQVPTDFPLTPPAYERDQAAAQDAETALHNFVADHSDSPYAAEAADLLRQTREMLARAEMNIAEFYLSRNRPEATIARLQTVLDRYEGSGVEPEALLKMGETYLLMGRRDDARDAFQMIVSRYTRSSYVQAARNYLAMLGPAPAATAAPAATPSTSATPAGTDGAGGANATAGSGG